MTRGSSRTDRAVTRGSSRTDRALTRGSSRPRRTLVAGLALLAAACAREVDRPGVPPRHVLLVTVSSLRPDHMSAFGYFRPTTVWETDPGARPLGEGKALDDLAAEGVLFARAFAPSPRTGASLAALLTGRFPERTGVLADGDVLPADAETLAESFSDAGFRTVAFASGDLPAEGDGLLQGFGEVHRAAGDVATMQAAIDWLEEADLGDWRPLLLWLHLSDPGLPYEPTPLGPRPGGEPGKVPYDQLFTDPGYAGPATGGAEFQAALPAGGVPLDDADREHLVALYDGEIARTNNALRRFLAYYQEHGEAIGLWEDTVIAFAGVHGERLGEVGGAFGPPDGLREEELRVPLFLRHPNSMTGQRILDDVVDLCDLAPTLREWFGLGGPRGDGRSLLGATDSFRPRPFEARAALAVRDPGEYAVRTPDWRWIHPVGELFDCRGAGAYRAARPADDPAIARRLQEVLDERLAEVLPRAGER